MTLPNGFSEADRDRLAKELLKIRADAKKRSAAANRKKREAGMVTVTHWVPKDKAEEFKGICKNALTKFASDAAIAAMRDNAQSSEQPVQQPEPHHEHVHFSGGYQP